MASICKDCGKEMTPGNGCTMERVSLTNGEDIQRTRYGDEHRGPWEMPEFCHDCNVAKGQTHHFGCDLERCPKCGGQLIGCACFEEKE